MGEPHPDTTPAGPLIELDSNELRYWSADELASFVTHPGAGRVLSVRTGVRDPSRMEASLKGAGYQIGKLPVMRESSHLPHAAATFQPDVIYVTLTEPMGFCLEALESLATDPRTQMLPVVALIPKYASSALIEEAYSRSGCDFFRMEGTEVELLARTHLLVRLARANAEARSVAIHEPPSVTAANSPMGNRLDLHDPVTGVHSQTYFLHRLPTEVSRARRYQRPLSLMAIRSPAAASDDTVATKVAQAVRGRIRAADLVARVETGLFAVLLPETGPDSVGPLAERVREDLAELGIESSVGFAGLDDEEHGTYTSMQLLQAAATHAEV